MYIFVIQDTEVVVKSHQMTMEIYTYSRYEFYFCRLDADMRI